MPANLVATLVDTDALWHAALYATLGAMAFVAAFGVAILARDRAARARPGTRASAVAWKVTMGVALLGCLAVLSVGVWAMTQKP
jgi:hypothetical protein